MDDSGTLILMPTNDQMKGLSPISINTPLNKQVLKLVAYKYKSDAALVADYINVFISEISSASHLLDSSSSSTYLALPVSNIGTETFVHSCDYNFNMSSNLPRSFYLVVKLVVQETGVMTDPGANDRIMLVFNYQNL